MRGQEFWLQLLQESTSEQALYTEANFHHSPPRRSTKENAARLLFCRGSRSLGSLGVFFLEAFDAAGGIDQLLLTGKERMAVGADFYLDQIAAVSRASLESMATRAMNGDGVIIGMNSFFHEGRSCAHAGLRGVWVSPDI